MTDRTEPQRGKPSVSVASQIERLEALVERERQTRFSGGAFGYLWAYSTPVAWIAFVVIFFWILGRTPPIAVGAEIFVATGILPYALYRQTITSMMRTLIASRYMAYYTPVNGQDILLASAVLELVNMILTSLLIFGGIILLFGTPLPANLLVVYAAMAMAWALGVGMGSLFAAIGQASDSFARAVPLVLRPLFWISGIFFTATELPAQAQALFWWNPLFHCIEALREGFFIGYQSPVAELWYPAVIAVSCYLASAVVERHIRHRRLARHHL
ncbi:ABC transporter permease [Yoonia sp. R2-816]|uniref:ABC transporter permease n=1 Tax=Yoonia sp. R2-816 TaxID=3342638 RepID=UPI00372BBF66